VSESVRIRWIVEGPVSGAVLDTTWADGTDVAEARIPVQTTEQIVRPTVKNNGGTAVTITDVDVQGVAGVAGASLVAPVTIQAGQSAEVEVRIVFGTLVAGMVAEAILTPVGQVA